MTYGTHRSIMGESRAFRINNEAEKALAEEEMHATIRDVKIAAARWEMKSRAEPAEGVAKLPAKVVDNEWPLRAGDSFDLSNSLSHFKFIEPFVNRTDAAGVDTVVKNTGWERAEYELEFFSEEAYEDLDFSQKIVPSKNSDRSLPQGYQAFLWTLDFPEQKTGKPVFYRWVKRHA